MLKKAIKITKQAVTKFDLFANAKLLRHSEEPEYKSFTGGILSLAVLIAIVIVFSSTVTDTLNMTNISSTSTFFQDSDPTEFSTTTSGFLLAVGITNFNLTDAHTKYFNIQFSQKISNPKTTINYNLVPCSRAAWTSLYPDIADQFDRNKLQYWLCLPSNTTLAFQGKYTSDIFKYLKLGVKACSIQAGDNRTCVNQSVIDNYITKNGPLAFNYYFVNTIINANDQNYLGNYFQDKNYFTFTMQTGSTANIFVSVFQIQTDVSLLPLTKIVQDVGGIVIQPTQTFIQPVTVGTPYYVQLYIRKSSLSLLVTRAFYKYLDCLSYIGGLVGAILIALFFMQFYNEFSYQVCVSSDVYKDPNNKKISSQYFNIATFFGYVFYNVIRFFGGNPKWKLLQQFDVSRKQINKQLSIKLILQKIQFLQNCMQYLFQDFQLKCLHLKGKLNLNEAKNIRKRFSSRPRLMKLKKKKQEKDQSTKVLQFSKAPSINPLEIQKEVIAEVRSSFQQVHSEVDIKKTSKLINNSSSRIMYPDGGNVKKQKEVQQQELSQSSLSSQSDNEEQEFRKDILNSLERLEYQAKLGKQRCVRIYKSLDEVIKKVPSHFMQQSIKFDGKMSLQNLQKPKNQQGLEMFDFDIGNN